MSAASNSFSIRDLPLPAKLVVTCFLLAVGGGYTSAMVQLHFQDSKSGEMMPTVKDVILKFTGKQWFETDPPKPVSKFVKLILAPEEGPAFGSNGTMSPAFFAKDDGTYNRLSRGSESERKRLHAEREGERNALALWANSPADVREKAYRDNRFILDSATAPASITPEFKTPDGAIAVKSIVDARCARCHGKDGAQSAFPLETLEQIEKYLNVPAFATVKPGGDWVRVEEPIGLEKLTQSTHAHLLSFSMLFALTGLVFAFTSYPTALRCILGPWVLLAVVSDVSLWWLARLCNDWGPYFAMGVIGTGGAAGAGLAGQIVLSLWNIYGVKGRLVLAVLFALAGAAASQVYLNQVQPGLVKKQNALNAKANAEADPQGKPEETKPSSVAGQPKPEPEKKTAVAPTIGVPQTITIAGTSPMERILRFPVKDAEGKELPLLKIPFKEKQDGGMVRAFFDKDAADFSKAVKDKDQQAQDALKPERFGELDALRAWLQLNDAERKKSYEADAFVLPASLAGKPLTPEYLDAGRVKIKTMMADRCVRCHAPGADAEKYPFETYEQILQQMIPKK